MRKTLDTNNEKPGAMLRFLYKTVPGRAALKVLTKPWVSECVGDFMSCGVSKVLIPSFVKKNHIDLSRYDVSNIRCYNDFFCRKLKQGCLKIDSGLISPCDAKLTAYRISDDLLFNVKGSEYSVEEILDNSELAFHFAGGVCLIFRLTVDNYHRYIYFDDCREAGSKSIKGELHTVQPIAFHRYKVYHRNSREYTVLETKNFGEAVQIEVGAMCVGKIDNYHAEGDHKRGEEKGKFLFGGSTVILLLNDVSLDQEIFDNTEKGLETIVTIGERIGK